MIRTFLALLLLAGSTAALQAAPPTDPEALKTYTHCRGWLLNFPASYIVTNIRSTNDGDYRIRRIAALDLLREKRDFGTVYDLMVELNKDNFLNEPIIDLIVEWKAKRAIPVLEQISKDKKRSKALRAKAQAAALTLAEFRPAAPPKFY